MNNEQIHIFTVGGTLDNLYSDAMLNIGATSPRYKHAT